jgi:hypothetical protein
MQRNRRAAMALAMALATVPALAKDFYVYPQKGQSAQQQEKDEFECFKWAKQQSGFDPMSAGSNTTAPPAQVTQGGTVKGAARGAAVGAIGGAIGGDAGKGAAIGAGTGAAVGTIRRRSAEREQAAQQQQSASQASAGRANYDRAYSACMGGRGYTVK